MKITKTITESGGEKQVIEKILELTVKPGWKEGTSRASFDRCEV
jgi:hypothetical protein